MSESKSLGSNLKILFADPFTRQISVHLVIYNGTYILRTKNYISHKAIPTEITDTL